MDLFLFVFTDCEQGFCFINCYFLFGCIKNTKKNGGGMYVRVIMFAEICTLICFFFHVFCIKHIFFVYGKIISIKKCLEKRSLMINQYLEHKVVYVLDYKWKIMRMYMMFAVFICESLRKT